MLLADTLFLVSLSLDLLSLSLLLLLLLLLLLFSGTRQKMAYAVDINLIGDDIKTIERNADVLLNACKDIGITVNSKTISTYN